MADNEGTPTQTTDAAEIPAVPETAAPAKDAVNPDISVAELREWLRRWVSEATGQPLENITVDRPMEEFGLASRDALALGGDIEELTGVVLNATVVYQHPTIGSLAEVVVNGVPELPEDSVADDAFYAGYTPGEAHDIAIVGLSTRLPGAGNTPESTWDFLIGRGDGIRELPEGRWEEFTADPGVKQIVEESNTLGGYLDQDVIKGFDAEFFAMSPVEVERVDPQQRLMMELTWEALEHARIPASDLRGEAVGMFVGSSTSDFQLIAALGLGDIDPNVPISAEAYALLGASTGIIANRVSYFFDFRGPSITIDTACSSTIVAVHQAVRALRDGDADLALAGGVNMILAPVATLGFEKNGAVAKDGHIKAFSSDADGMVRSEGAGLVVLKRLADAERDGDNILAVIKGSAVNSDGRSNGLFAPNPEAQADVLRRAYRDAGIKPSTVDYIEAHGTGTPIGDPIEAEALGRVIGRGRDADKPALLGSAKTNFGHLESGAGAASLAKVVMSFQHNVIPPNLGYAGPSPFIPFEQAHLKVVDQPTEYPRYSGTATVGISGFGFGGTNAHVVLQEYKPTPVVPAAERDEDIDAEVSSTDVVAEATAIAADAVPEPEWTDREEPLPVILAVSGYLPSRRRRAAQELADWLEADGKDVPLEDVARSLAKRSHWRSRGVVIAKDNEEAVAGLRAIAAGKPGNGVFTVDAPAARGPLWVMAGFGAQHRKMGKQLYTENRIFRATVDKIDELVVDEAGYSVREMILDDAQDWDIGTGQVGTFTIQAGLAAILRAHGAEPDGVVGHSQGEVAGAYISGGLPLEDAVRVIVSRGRLMAEGEQMITDDQVRNMALVELSAEDVEAMLPDFPEIELAVFAAPTNTVIGGPPDQVHAIVAKVEEQGKFARVLQTRGAGHTSQMDVLLGELAAELAGIEPTALQVDLYSTAHKSAVYKAGHEPVHNEDYWVTNMRGSVYFTNAIRAAVDSGITTFLELAPNSVALMQVMGTTFAAGVPNAALIPTLKRKEDESAAVISALAQLYVNGHRVDLSSLLPAGPYADIPRTTFVRKEFWPKGKALSTGSGNAKVPGAHVSLPDGRHVWEVQAAAVTDLGALVNAAAAQVLSDVQAGASYAYAPVPVTGTLTTTLTPYPGGAAAQVHAKEGNSFKLLFDGVVTSGAPLPEPVAVQPVQTATPTTEVAVVESFGDRWDPNGSQKLEDRLALIVAESMGYAVEDLPMEIPLMELGLDSLMAMRIKNRVEYEFDIPQLQIQAVRDANLTEVGKVLRYAIEHRDEVAAIAERQAAGEEVTIDADFVNQARAAMEAGEDPAAIAKAAAVEAKQDAVESAAAVKKEAVESAAAAKRDAVESAAAAKRDAVESAAAAKKEAIESAAGALVADAAVTTESAPVAGDAVLGGVAYEADEDDVPPRDAAERLAYGTWALVTGKSAGGIFNTLPILEEEVAEKMAARLTERVGAEITVDDVLDCETIEALAEIVRNLQDSGVDVDGFVRPLRARTEGSNAVPVFVFHPAGGNTLVYEPLLKKLPADTPMYGFERVDGSIEERAREYLPELRKIQGDGPYVLYGWSLGAVLALQVGQLLREEGADVRTIGLIDLARTVKPEDNSPEERVRRIERYQAFAKKTYNVPHELDRDQLEELAAASDEDQFKMIGDLVKLSGAKIPGGVLEHQRTSWLENRELQKVQPRNYDGDVVLYLADRYHDGAIELEPRFADRLPNGGWEEFIPNLEVVHIPGDHLQIVDEPRIGKIGTDLAAKLAEIEAKGAK
ncbi:polyketide synthase Pks13 [Nocardia sp. XZ_19_385]|uniref:polyketide synthase Pks13 n=1 Tax=Nocardia sp. XZ_19_385 TaxID=2769488 RepID=UPI00188F6D37|nr:polyketide synthase Pks13 [Nocardia sp. XZ_19_385]